MMAELRERVARQLLKHESKRHRMYLDSVGVPTIGIGHNLRNPISDAAITLIFNDDLDKIERAVERELPWIHALSLPRQAVLYDMAFNLGINGLLGFVRMLDAAQAEDWETAAKEMLSSKWAGQVGARALLLAQQMFTGELQPL